MVSVFKYAFSLLFFIFKILKKSNSTKEGMEFHLIVISCNNQSGFETEVLQEMATTGITPHFIHCGENGIENMEKIRLQGRTRAASK